MTGDTGLRVTPDQTGGVVVAVVVDLGLGFLLFVALMWDRLARQGFRSAPVTLVEYREWLAIMFGWALAMAVVAVVGYVARRPAVVTTQALVAVVVMACWTPMFYHGWHEAHHPPANSVGPAPGPVVTPGPARSGGRCFGGHGDCPGG